MRRSTETTGLVRTKFAGRAALLHTICAISCETAESEARTPRSFSTAKLYSFSVRLTWMKCSFWLIPNLVKASRQTVLVLCCLFCFCVVTLEVIGVFSILPTVYGEYALYFDLFMYRPAHYAKKRSRRELHFVWWRSSECNWTVSMSEQDEYWVKVVPLSVLCLPALMILRRYWLYH